MSVLARTAARLAGNAKVDRAVAQSQWLLVVASTLLLALLVPGCASQPQSPATATALPEPTSTASPTVSAFTAPTQAYAAQPKVPNFSHVFIILMENKSYDDIIGSARAPYLNQLAEKYGDAAQYYGVRHPSLPNYLALVSGSTQGMDSDCATCSFDAPNLADQMEAQGKTWGAYVEDLPSPCFDGPSAGDSVSGLSGLVGDKEYARKHNPWMYFDDIQQNPARCQQVVPFSQFAADLQNNRLPDFVWITPNESHNMHSASIEDGDKWLAGLVPQILASPAWKESGVLFVVWDEGNGDEGIGGGEGGGHTVALVISPRGKPGYKSDVPYNHYSLLRTIEEAWNLGYLGHAGDPGTQAMADFFR